MQATCDRMAKKTAGSQNSRKVSQCTNENGRWDTGNYDQKKQAEYRKVFSIEKLRANWEVESLIDWQQP